jgi:hypothetical protein
MFSSRTPSNLDENRLAQAVGRMRRESRPFIDLTASNPTQAGIEYPPALLEPLGDPRGLRYEPAAFGLVEARRAVATEYARRGFAVPEERIVLAASTSDAYSLLFKLLADPGDEVLVPRPSYPLFDHLLRLDGLVPRHYDLEYQGRWQVDVDSAAAAITPRTRAILLVSPNNPTGSIVSAAELDALSAICAGAHAALIVDEVFADYVLPPGAGVRAGRVVDRRDALAFSLGGLSKSIGLPQVKLGWIAAAGPDDLVRQALDRLEIVCDAYLSVATPVQAAAAELLRDGAAVRARIAERTAANEAALRRRAADAPACHVLPVEAGWYAVVRVPAIEAEEDLVIDLLTKGGVLTHPGYFFDFPREAFLIVSLLPSPDAFADGVDRILRHFDCSEPRP